MSISQACSINFDQHSIAVSKTLIPINGYRKANPVRILAIASFLAVVYCESAFGQEPEVANPAPVSLDVATARALASPSSVEFFDTPLEDALAFLADKARVELFVHRRDLEDYGIRVDVQVDLTMTDLPVRAILDTMLHEVIGDLDWYLDSGVVHVTSREEAEYRTVVKVYNVASLLPKSEEPYSAYSFYGYSGGGVIVGGCGEVTRESAEDTSSGDSANGDGGGFFQFADAAPDVDDREATEAVGQTAPDGAPRQTDFYDFDTLIEAIQGAVATDLWENMGGIGTITPIVVGDKPLLVVKHNPRAHEDLANLLDRLAEFANP